VCDSSEVERLRAENKLLRAELEDAKKWYLQACEDFVRHAAGFKAEIERMRS
jgi:hypothetical protein